MIQSVPTRYPMSQHCRPLNGACLPAGAFPEASDTGVVGRVLQRSDPVNSGKVERISLPPEIERSAPRRQADFRAGRFAAGMALQAMGYDGLVPRCERGLPVWPGGLLGSISHTAEYAWAAVVRKQQVAGIGVDCEGLLATAVASELWQLVGTAGERDLLSGAFGFTEAVTILFSAKEAIYKCLNPVTGWALDFSDVKLVGFAGGSLQAEVSAERFADLQTLQLDIEFCFRGNHFFSLCLLPVDSPVAENAFGDPAISAERMPS